MLLRTGRHRWDTCVSLPHVKDAYWLGVDYGVVDEAKQEVSASVDADRYL